MRQIAAMLKWIGALLLSFILRIPYVLGALVGVLGLCVVAFLAGFHAVYDGSGV